MDNKKYEVLGGGAHQLDNNQLFNLQLFADTLKYNKVDNPYNFYLNKPTWTKGDIKKVYNLVKYYLKIPNYDTITTLPEENANYIKEALPNVTNCATMLYSCKALTSVDTTGWDTSNVTDMISIFYNCNALTTLDVSNWDTSNVTIMSNMFAGCESLTTLDVSKFDTSKVTDMNWMFYDCNKLTTLNVSNWNTSKVTNMSFMFRTCNSLTTLDLSNWDTSNVGGMNWMFYGCNALTTLDVSNWDTSNVTDMRHMFAGCTLLTTIKGVIDMKSCTLYDSMFRYCNKLTGVKIKNPPADFETESGLRKDQYEIVS